ncbi:MAG: Crp/Fnr family transcriptional regulator [Pseudomonadota bacterium]
MDALRQIPSRPGVLLPTLPPWCDIDDDSRRILLDGAQHVVADRDTYLDTSAVIVIRGVLALERELSDGRRILVALFHDGDLIDFRQSDRARQCRIMTVAPSDILTFDEGWVDACLSRHPSIGAIVDRQLKRQQARANDHIADLAAKTPLERLASVLFELGRWPDSDVSEKGEPIVRVPIRRTDIADYLGMKPETLSRAVRALEQEGLIQTLETDQILMIDVIGLRRIANGGRPRRSTRTG